MEESKMIEKWKSVKKQDLSDWASKVEEAMVEGKIYKNVDDPVPLNLTLNGIDDRLIVITDNVAKGILRIEVDEETHEATEMRDENVEYINLFVARHLPYLKFLSKRERDSYRFTFGFDLLYSVEKGE